MTEKLSIIDGILDLKIVIYLFNLKILMRSINNNKIKLLLKRKNFSLCKDHIFESMILKNYIYLIKYVHASVI